MGRKLEMSGLKQSLGIGINILDICDIKLVAETLPDQMALPARNCNICGEFWNRKACHMKLSNYCLTMIFCVCGCGAWRGKNDLMDFT